MIGANFRNRLGNFTINNEQTRSVPSCPSVLSKIQSRPSFSLTCMKYYQIARNFFLWLISFYLLFKSLICRNFLQWFLNKNLLSAQNYAVSCPFLTIKFINFSFKNGKNETEDEGNVWCVVFFASVDIVRYFSFSKRSFFQFLYLTWSENLNDCCQGRVKIRKTKVPIG